MLYMKVLDKLALKNNKNIMEVTEKDYYKNKRIGEYKLYIKSIYHFREILFNYQPSMIWYDCFSKDIPYINGYYYDNFFHGSYSNQSFLTFDLNSLNQLENIFKEDMYIYI
jgi:hypothetical protein